MPATYYQRLAVPPRGSFFLFGLRGVGKSTWVRSHFEHAYIVDLLDETRFHALAANPGSFADEVRAIKPQRAVVIDEVQRVPALLNEVHRSIEMTRRRFVLVGSSARRLKTAGTNLLAGRATFRTMYPLLPAELGDDFDLNRVLQFGSVPLIWHSEKPEETLNAYVQSYVREEIRAEALVRNLPAFLRFLPVAALFHGQVINIAGLARDSAIARTTVDGYIGILQDTLLATLLPGFEKKLRVRERKHPKLYWNDPGIVRAAKRHSGVVGSEERGPLLEGLVLMVLRAHNELSRIFDEIFYWAPLQARATEVDFLLRRGKEYLAIEVKSQIRYSTNLLSGLRAIAGLQNVVRRILVYGGTQKLETEDGIEILPLKTFFEVVASRHLWP